jgi:predicted RNA binding protein YcfA (HicA-like mRNA interferase family)
VSAPLYLLQVRMELDRMLRARPFFSRAVRGDLQPLEYRDLVAQLGFLVTALPGSHVRLANLADGDLLTLPHEEDDPGLPRACLALRLLADTVARHDDRAQANTVCVGVLGTSWTADAAQHLEVRYPGGATLLRHLSHAGSACVEQLRWTQRPPHSTRVDVATFAELTRGALLGLAAYLDSSWAAPIHVLSTA